jgi:hypothetical protein
MACILAHIHRAVRTGLAGAVRFSINDRPVTRLRLPVDRAGHPDLSKE